MSYKKDCKHIATEAHMGSTLYFCSINDTPSLPISGCDGCKKYKAAKPFYPLSDQIIDDLVKRTLEAQEIMLKYEVEANTIVLNGKKYAVLVKDRDIPTVCGLTTEVRLLPDEIDFAVQYRAVKQPKSNADFIRHMSNEELAGFLWSVERGCNKARFIGEWREWLDEEAE